MWDVFICHASEDKDAIAGPLADALSGAGLSVWYDQFILTLGDSLRRSIDRGLAGSRYGVVILSPHFFEKNWPQRELDGLTAKETSSGKTILPVWHNLTREQVEQFSFPLADKAAISTSVGVPSVARAILQAVRPDPPGEKLVSETGSTESPFSQPVKADKPKAAFDLKFFEYLMNFAYSSSGLGLTRSEAAQWAEEYLERFSTQDFGKFKELVDFAHSSNGLSLTRSVAAQWAEKYLDRFPTHDFGLFKELMDFAYSTNGLRLCKNDAAEWAEKRLEVFTRRDFRKFKELMDFAYGTNGLRLSKSDAAEWAEKHLELFTAQDFGKFKKFMEFAYSSSGLGLSKSEAAEWAIQKMQ